MCNAHQLFYPFTFEPPEIIAPDEDRDGTGVGNLAAHQATGSAQIRIYRLSNIEDTEPQPRDRWLETQRFIKHTGGLDSDGQPVIANGIKCLSSLVAGLRYEFSFSSLPVPAQRHECVPTRRLAFCDSIWPSLSPSAMGPRYLREPVPWRKALRLDELDNPIFTFEFRFETRERLIDLDRIPEGEATPSPARETAIRAGGELDGDLTEAPRPWPPPPPGPSFRLEYPRNAKKKTKDSHVGVPSSSTRSDLTASSLRAFAAQSNPSGIPHAASPSRTTTTEDGTDVSRSRLGSVETEHEADDEDEDDERGGQQRG